VRFALLRFARVRFASPRSTSSRSRLLSRRPTTMRTACTLGRVACFATPLYHLRTEAIGRLGTGHADEYKEPSNKHHRQVQTPAGSELPGKATSLRSSAAAQRLPDGELPRRCRSSVAGAPCGPGRLAIGWLRASEADGRGPSWPCPWRARSDGDQR
jgi:hypothetical protein